MKLFNRKKTILTVVLGMGTFLSGCGGGSDKVVSDILDDVDTSHQASISYVNALENSTVFYAKSTVYPDDVYRSKHRVIEVLANQTSDSINHEWINGAKETQFAIEDGNSASHKEQKIQDLQDNRRYWSIAWQHAGERELSVFEKNPTNEAGKYKVRIFANAELDISINQQTAISSTEIDEISASFAIEGCSDLQVGVTPIDLCQNADFGRSYLVVVDADTSAVVIAQE